MMTLTERCRNFTGNNEALIAILDEAASNIANENKVERYEFADQMAAMRFVVDTYIEDVLNESRELSDYDYIKVACQIARYGMTIEEALNECDIVDLFQGTFKELAYDLFDSGVYGECSKEIEMYIDWDFMAKELRHDYWEYEFDKDQYIIRNA